MPVQEICGLLQTQAEQDVLKPNLLPEKPGPGVQALWTAFPLVFLSIQALPG